MQCWRITLPPQEAEQLAQQLEETALVVAITLLPQGAVTVLELLLPDETQFMLLRSELAGLGIGAAQIADLTLPADGWLERVYQSHPPLRCRGLLIYDRAHRHERAAWGRNLEIEAATAFGTGAHATTFGCLVLLQHVLQRSPIRRALDIGTGSGVLALAARRLGVPQVVATDNDAEAIRVTRQHACRNGLAHGLSTVVAVGAGHRLIQRQAPYDLLLANILRRPVMALAPAARALVRPRGWVILSGLLAGDVPAVLALWRGLGWHLLARHYRDGWAALLLR